MNKPNKPCPPDFYLKACCVIKRWTVGTHDELPFNEFKAGINVTNCNPLTRRFLRIDRIYEATNEMSDEVLISLVEEKSFANPYFEELWKKYLTNLEIFKIEIKLYNSPPKEDK